MQNDPLENVILGLNGLLRCNIYLATSFANVLRENDWPLSQRLQAMFTVHGPQNTFWRFVEFIYASTSPNEITHKNK